MKVAEKILMKRTNQDGGEEYLVKWKGLPHWECSWEPLANLDCRDKLQEFREQKDSVNQVKEDFLARWQGVEPEDSWVSPRSKTRFSEFEKQVEELNRLNRENSLAHKEMENKKKKKTEVTAVTKTKN